MTQPRKFNNKNVLRQDRQPIELVGIATATAPDVSATDEARLYYDKTTDTLMLSTEGGAYAALTDGRMVAAEVTFTENGAGTYTGSVSVPAGATIHDIIVHAVALWSAATSAAMDVGDVADPNGFFAGIDLKATDLLAGESISFSHPGGKQGADLDAIDVGGEGGAAAGSDVHVRRRYLATARVISGVVVSVGAGTAGRTRLTVLYSLPVATAATKA